MLKQHEVGVEQWMAGLQAQEGANAPVQVLKRNRTWAAPAPAGEKPREGRAKGLVKKIHFATQSTIPSH